MIFLIGVLISLGGSWVWVQRFSRLLGEHDPAERQAELLGKSRQASFYFTLILIASLFGGMMERSPHARGHAVNLIGLFLIASMIQGQIFFKVNRRIRKIELSSVGFLRLTVRGISATLAMYCIYFLTVVGGMGVFHKFTGGVHFSGAWGAASYVLALILLVALAIWGVALLSPLFIRLTVPCKEIADPSLIARLETAFRSVGIPIPSFWSMELKHHKVHNAMVAGSSMGRGVFRQALFLTSDLSEKLSPDELNAIVLHEISHLSLRHIRKRMLWGAVAFAMALMAGVGISMVLLIVPIVDSRITAIVVMLVVIGIQMALLRRVVRRQELEADENAVKLGASLGAMSSALLKLSTLNGQSPDRKDPNGVFCVNSAHPTVSARIEHLATRSRAGFPRLPNEFQITFGFLKSHALGVVLVIAAFGVGGRYYWSHILKPKFEIRQVGDSHPPHPVNRSVAGAKR